MKNNLTPYLTVLIQHLEGIEMRLDRNLKECLDCDDVPEYTKGFNILLLQVLDTIKQAEKIKESLAKMMSDILIAELNLLLGLVVQIKETAYNYRNSCNENLSLGYYNGYKVSFNIIGNELRDVEERLMTILELASE